MSRAYPVRYLCASCRILLTALLLAGFAGSPAAAQPEPPVPRLVKDINTTNLSSTYLGGAQVGNLFFFFTCEADAPSIILWKTDGSEAGTLPVAEK